MDNHIIECLKQGDIHIGSSTQHLLIAHFEPKQDSVEKFIEQSQRGVKHALMCLCAKVLQNHDLKKTADEQYPYSIGIRGDIPLGNLLEKAYGYFSYYDEKIWLVTKEVKIPDFNSKPGIYQRVISGETLVEITEQVISTKPTLVSTESVLC